MNDRQRELVRAEQELLLMLYQIPPQEHLSVVLRLRAKTNLSLVEVYRVTKEMDQAGLVKIQKYMVSITRYGTETLDKMTEPARPRRVQ